MLHIIQNTLFNREKAKSLSNFSLAESISIENFHKKIGNTQTPLCNLTGLAKELGVGKVLLKDESHRFGLNAFKALGASYAMYRQIKINPQIKSFCTATDGNHGKGVAWIAKKLGRKALIYMPKGTSYARSNSIEEEGAKVIIIDDGYDNAVKIANSHVKKRNTSSEKNTWSLIQDTAWEGYEEIPLDIMKGYWTQAHEISRQIKEEKIDLLFLQSGVGSWAASIINYILKQWDTPPICVGVEPNNARCLYESIKAGDRVSFKSRNQTIMAGLDCGTVSTLAWKILKHSLTGVVTISDEVSKLAMRRLAFPLSNDPIIISGESGASGLGALMSLCESKKHKNFKEKINLNKDSTILLINTEGDTDPYNYKKIVSEIKK